MASIPNLIEDRMQKEKKKKKVTDCFLEGEKLTSSPNLGSGSGFRKAFLSLKKANKKSPSVEAEPEIPKNVREGGLLQISIIRGRNLSGGQEVDPFCKIQFLDYFGNVDQKMKEFQTKAVSKSCNPIWEETFDFEFETGEFAGVKIICRDNHKNSLIGYIVIEGSLLKDCEEICDWYPLALSDGKQIKNPKCNLVSHVNGDIQLKLLYFSYSEAEKRGFVHVYSSCAEQSNKMAQILKKHFQVAPEEEMIDYFSCTYKRKQGFLFVTNHHICFYSRIFGDKTKAFIDFHDVKEILQRSRILSEIKVTVNSGKEFLFRSFLHKSKPLKLLKKQLGVVRLGKNNNNNNNLLPRVGPSDNDSLSDSDFEVNGPGEEVDPEDEYAELDPTLFPGSCLIPSDEYDVSEGSDRSETFYDDGDDPLMSSASSSPIPRRNNIRSNSSLASHSTNNLPSIDRKGYEYIQHSHRRSSVVGESLGSLSDRTPLKEGGIDLKKISSDIKRSTDSGNNHEKPLRSHIHQLKEEEGSLSLRNKSSPPNIIVESPSIHEQFIEDVIPNRRLSTLQEYSTQNLPEKHTTINESTKDQKVDEIDPSKDINFVHSAIPLPPNNDLENSYQQVLPFFATTFAISVLLWMSRRWLPMLGVEFQSTRAIINLSLLLSSFQTIFHGPLLIFLRSFQDFYPSSLPLEVVVGGISSIGYMIVLFVIDVLIEEVMIQSFLLIWVPAFLLYFLGNTVNSFILVGNPSHPHSQIPPLRSSTPS